MEPPNGTRWRLDDIERRLAHLEALEIAVLAQRVLTLEQRVSGLTRALYTTAVMLIATSVTFAVNVIQGTFHK